MWFESKDLLKGKVESGVSLLKDLLYWCVEVEQRERIPEVLIIDEEQSVVTYRLSEANPTGEMAKPAKKIFDELNINYQQLSADDLFTRQITDGISFNDPAGNLIELYHGRLNDETKFTSPKGISGFVTKDLGFGHVVYAALNIEETHDFYINVLGFGDSDIMNLQMSPNPEDPKMKLYFMHCDNKRHHTVAIMQSPTPPSGLVHTMVEVKTIDEVGEALDRAINNDIHISSSLGRHMNDKMVSFYMQTPGGFDLEFGYDGDQPDWSKHQTTSSPAPSYWGHVFTPPPEK